MGRPGLLTYLLTYYLVDFVIAVFLENSENDLKLKDWIQTLAFTGIIYFHTLGFGLDLWSVALAY